MFRTTEIQQDQAPDQPGTQSSKALEIPLVRPEGLGPLVTSFFRELSAEQWRMIAAGTVDSATRSLLANMCMEIIQTVSTEILDSLLPMIPKYMETYGTAALQSEGGSTTSLRPGAVLNVSEEHVIASVGSSLHQCVTDALGVQEHRSEDSEKLTELVGKEVAQKVNSVLAVASQTPASEVKESSVFVSGCVSCTTTLHKMVVHAAGFMKTCVVKVARPLMCWKTKALCSDDEVIMVPSGVIAASERSAANVLALPSIDSAVLEDIQSDVQDSQMLNDAFVSDETAKSEGKGRRLSPVSTHLGSPVATKLKAFFALKSHKTKRTPLSHRERYKSKFSKFAKEYICNMVERLMRRGHMSQAGRAKVTIIEDSEGVVFPGAILESPETAPETRVILVRLNDDNSKTMRAISSTVNDLLDVVFHDDVSFEGHRDSLTCFRERLEKSRSSRLSKELTDNIYSLVSGQDEPIPTVSARKCLSDSMLYRADRWHEGRYVQTEEEVRRFFSQGALWCTVESTRQTSLSDSIIQYRNMATDFSVPLIRITEATPERDVSSEIRIAWTPDEELVLVVAESDHLDSERRSSEIPDVQVSSDNSDVSTTDSVPSAAVVMTEMDTEYRYLVTSLLVRLLTHTAVASNTSLGRVDFDEIINRLSERAIAEILGTAAVTNPKGLSVKKIHKAVFGELCQEFGSANVLQAAVDAEDPAFDHAVVKALATQLQIASAKKKPSLLKRLKKLCSRSKKASCSGGGGGSSGSCVGGGCNISTCVQPAADEDAVSEDSSAPAKKRKNPVKRFFSRVARCITEPFASCMSGDS